MVAIGSRYIAYTYIIYNIIYVYICLPTGAMVCQPVVTINYQTVQSYPNCMIITHGCELILLLLLVVLIVLHSIVTVNTVGWGLSPHHHLTGDASTRHYFPNLWITYCILCTFVHLCTHMHNMYVNTLCIYMDMCIIHIYSLDIYIYIYIHCHIYIYIYGSVYIW